MSASDLLAKTIADTTMRAAAQIVIDKGIDRKTLDYGRITAGMKEQNALHFNELMDDLEEAAPMGNAMVQAVMKATCIEWAIAALKSAGVLETKETTA